MMEQTPEENTPQSEHSATEDVSYQEDWQAGRAEVLAIVSLATISLVVALDSTIIVPVLPTLAVDLNGSAIESFWAGTSFLLASATFQPFIGALSDIFGRRGLLLGCIFLFALGSRLACLAHEFRILLAGRTLQGIGGGGIIVLVLVICTDIIPLRQRPQFTSYVQIPWGVGTVSGPLIGAAFAEKVTWRWIFYINFPICGIGTALVLYSIRFRDRHTSFANKVSEVDWTGGFLFITTSTSLLLGLTWGGVQFAWTSYQTLLPLLLGAVGLLLTLLWEAKVANNPFIRMSLFKSRSGLSAYICAILQGFLMYAELYYLPFYLLSVQGYSPIRTGVGLIPVTAGLMPASIAIGIAITKFGQFRWALWLGWIVTTLGTGLLIILDASTRTYALVLIFLVVGIGQGLLSNSLNTTIQTISAAEDAAYASAMYAFMRGIGLCLGVAIGGSIFQNQLSNELRNVGLPLDIAGDAEGFVVTLNRLPSDLPLKISVVQAYTSSFKVLFIVLTAVSAASLMASLFISHHTMNKSLDSRHVLEQEPRRARSDFQGAEKSR